MTTLETPVLASNGKVAIEPGATIEAAWMLGAELPDVDAVIAAAREISA